jgi:MerR family transcriptional regulator, light-induced transcriptional regulator
LRKWRQRYGFPLLETSPNRAFGYSRATVDQLLSIKRLLECGYRPGQVVGKSAMVLARMLRAIADEAPKRLSSKSTLQLIEQVKQSNVAGLGALLAESRARGTLTEFVLNTIVPLAEALDTAWARREIEIHHEHLCSSLIERCLHAEILSCKPKRAYPTILFGGMTEERHLLGLLMAEAVLADQGANTINMGSHAPLDALKRGVAACDADVLALSFSIAFAARGVRPALVKLRGLLPAHVEIWAGGAGAALVRRAPKGVRIFSDFQAVIDALPELSRQRRGSRPQPGEVLSASR